VIIVNFAVGPPCETIAAVSVCNLADVVSLCKYYFKRILHVFFSSATIVNTGVVVRDQRSEAAPIASTYVYT
jgi:hypothetical protein